MSTRKWSWGLLVLLLSPVGMAHAGEFSRGIDEEAQLPYWQYADRGMSLRLVQRLPDQTRAFFIARGFSAREAEHIANACVFQTVFKNISSDSEPADLEYNLNDWIVLYQGQQRKMKLREHWAQEWQEKNIAMPARIAFEWSLYPTAQLYHPGDYNWGMSVFDLVPGSRFDLKISWRQYQQTHTVIIRDMECARDITLDAESRAVQ